VSQDKISSKSSSQSAGFSLTELLVVIVMFGLITTATYSLFREQGRISRTQQSILDMQSNGRAAINFLAQSFSHAGFGSGDTTPKFFDFTNSNPDKATITFGHKHVATVTSPIGTNPTKNISYSLATGQSISVDNMICIFPSLAPNVSHQVKKIGPPLEVEFDLVIVPAGAKIFRVHPVEFYVNNEVLYINDSDGEAPIVFDVAAFELAYREKGSTAWLEGTKNVDNPHAVYIYLVLKTKETEPGFKQGNPFELPWDKSNKPTMTIKDGYHYQSFETIVWIRNAK
jgi:prepilin-type N-terminal cleavage/methylation domain-containing protein